MKDKRNFLLLIISLIWAFTAFFITPAYSQEKKTTKTSHSKAQKAKKHQTKSKKTAASQVSVKKVAKIESEPTTKAAEPAKVENPTFDLTRLIAESQLLTKQPKQANNYKEFIKIMLPAVKSINEDIMADRKKLLSLEDKYHKQQVLLNSEEDWLKELAQNYRIESVDLSKTATWMKLKQRVDVIPPSLAIAQAANESAWGKSRFAQQANNYFGQYCYVKGCGIQPGDNPKGDARQAKRFTDVEEAVKSYINNLNSHKAYENLRKLRYEQRQKNTHPKGTLLAKGLIPYSTRGKNYVVRITNLIKTFNLEQFDNNNSPVSS